MEHSERYISRLSITISTNCYNFKNCFCTLQIYKFAILFTLPLKPRCFYIVKMAYQNFYRTKEFDPVRLVSSNCHLSCALLPIFTGKLLSKIQTVVFLSLCITEVIQCNLKVSRNCHVGKQEESIINLINNNSDKLKQ